MKIMSVNKALDLLPHHEGKEILIFGSLSYELECFCITHSPKKEIRKTVENIFISPSSIWIDLNFEDPYLNNETLTKWNNKKVVIEGKIYGPSNKNQGCGHLNGWPANIIAHRIKLYKKSH